MAKKGNDKTPTMDRQEIQIRMESKKTPLKTRQKSDNNKQDLRNVMGTNPSTRKSRNTASDGSVTYSGWITRDPPKLQSSDAPGHANYKTIKKEDRQHNTILANSSQRIDDQIELWRAKMNESNI